MKGELRRMPPLGKPGGLFRAFAFLLPKKGMDSGLFAFCGGFPLPGRGCSVCGGGGRVKKRDKNFDLCFKGQDEKQSFGKAEKGRQTDQLPEEKRTYLLLIRQNDTISTFFPVGFSRRKKSCFACTRGVSALQNREKGRI